MINFYTFKSDDSTMIKETYSVDAGSVLDHIAHLILDSMAVGFPVSHLCNLFMTLEVKIELYIDTQ